ncbi:MAG TPA: helix-hairpin-helix domain-containing protein [Thermoleophilaceae bacterium]|nr:helix-hairpin-helix domain-containing protein [Thermoleophilaceae bacterium]
MLCEPAADIFDGLVIATPRGDRYLPAEHVAVIHTRGVDLSISCAELEQLPSPNHEPRVQWDLDEPPPRPWQEIQAWLLDHLPHQHPARDDRVREARERLAERERAVKLAEEEPQLALELGIGRPDLSGSDHGGVVDVNHVPVDVLMSLPGVNDALARRIATTRDDVAGFASLEELGMLLDLAGDDVERLRGRVVFLPD